MGERILLIEDDPQLGAQIADFLGRAGFEPTWWTGGRPLQPGESSAYGLIILDLMLPGTYGMDILRQLREGSDVPVLISGASGSRVSRLS